MLKDPQRGEDESTGRLARSKSPAFSFADVPVWIYLVGLVFGFLMLLLFFHID